jgi:arginine decarboxylase
LHDVVQRKEDAQNMFNLGMLELSDKARVENLFWEICQELYRKSKEERYVPEEIAKLESQLSNQYVCNFSVFQSLLDHWALKQLFPIVPLNRLNEQPTHQATLADITCDSDGKIDKFTDLRDVRDSLPFHDPNGNPYYIGIFLTGAYQDIMGDFHNLLGKVNEVHIFLDPDEPEGYYVEETISGTMISEVLTMVQYETSDLIRQIKAQVDAAIKEDRVKPSEGMKLLDEYEAGLKQYTYPTKTSGDK